MCVDNTLWKSISNIEASKIEELSGELISNIFTFISITDIPSFSLTNKQFNAVGTDVFNLYRFLLKESTDEELKTHYSGQPGGTIYDVNIVSIPPEELINKFTNQPPNENQQYLPRSQLENVAQKIMRRLAPLCQWSNEDSSLDPMLGRGYCLQYLKEFVDDGKTINNGPLDYSLTACISQIHLKSCIIRLEELKYVYSIGALPCSNESWHNTIYQSVLNKASEDIIFWLLSVGAKPSTSEKRNSLELAKTSGYSDKLIESLDKAKSA